MTLLLATILCSDIAITTLLIFGQRNAIKQSVVGDFVDSGYGIGNFNTEQRSHGHTLTVEVSRFLRRISKVLFVSMSVFAVKPMQYSTKFVFFFSQSTLSALF
jgi:hypothetical protein